MSSDNKVESKFKASEELKAKFEEELTELDGRISRLRVLYDQYFTGVEKMEPMHLRREIDKIFKRSNLPQRGTTVLKFRYRSLLQRFTSYCSYWDRIVRLIEEGRIRRGVVDVVPPDGNKPKVTDAEQRFTIKASLASKSRRFTRPEVGGRRPEAGDGAAPGEARGTPGPEARHDVAPGEARGDYAATEVAALHARLVEEKKRLGEPTEKISPELVEKSIKKILEKTGGKDVRFRVIENGGRVSLTAVVKKGGA